MIFAKINIEIKSFINRENKHFDVFNIFRNNYRFAVANLGKSTASFRKICYVYIKYIVYRTGTGGIRVGVFIWSGSLSTPNPRTLEGVSSEGRKL